MTIYFVSRHAGSLQWAKQKELDFDVHLTHLSSLENLQSGDQVIGTLPINLVFELNKRGVAYTHLSLIVPLEWRGSELSVEQLLLCDITLEKFSVYKGH